MQTDKSDNPYQSPTSEPMPAPVAIEPVFAHSILGSRLLKHYLRLVGCLQLFYGMVFGFGAFRMAQFLIKFGLSLDRQKVLEAVIMGPLSALLALTSFIAGIGSLLLWRSCRKLQILYVGACVGFLASIMISDWIQHGKVPRDMMIGFLVAIPMILPYLPAIFLIKPPSVPSRASFERSREG